MRKNSPRPLEQSHTVAILMGTYNGAPYLAAQLKSISYQTHIDWGLHVSDDGSMDKTKELIDSFSASHPGQSIRYYNGPKKGFSANFLSLVCNQNISASFYAYSDQDDVWSEDKLSRAVDWLRTISPDKPALYCSRTEYVDYALNHIAFSPRYRRPPTFSNALVQNIASGNTMVFNQAARELICIAGADVDVPLHDWWTYLLVTGADGIVYFDLQPSVLYRQHSDNLWGMNAGWRARFSRIKKLFEGRFQGWNSRHLIALQSASPYLTVDNKRRVQFFVKSRSNEVLVKRLISLYQSGVYRQTLMANIGLVIAVFFRKL